MITNLDLTRLADGINVTLKKHTGGKKGYWHPASRTITTRRGLSIQEYKSTLAHELAHAFHGDCPLQGRFGRRQERRADKWAANLLLNPREVRDALAFNGSIEAASYDLEVTQHLLTIWLENNERIEL